MALPPNLVVSQASVSSATYTPPLAVVATAKQSTFQPGILVALSSGASLTYNVEVTGDDTTAPGYSESTGNWVPFSGASNLSASTAVTLGAAVTAIRLRVLTWTSGAATIQFIQVSA